MKPLVVEAGEYYHTRREMLWVDNVVLNNDSFLGIASKGKLVAILIDKNGKICAEYHCNMKVLLDRDADEYPDTTKEDSGK